MTTRRTMLAGALTLVAPRAGAQDGPVTITVPFTPGTGMDLLARMAAPALQEALGQPVVVENRPGASGNIGTQAVARSAPDGRTLMLTANTFVMNPRLFRQVPYDPVAGFTPIIHLTDGELVFAVHPAVPAESLAALAALGARQPLHYASPGNGTPQHLAMELFRLEAGATAMSHVPYRGSAPAVQDLLAGRVAAMVLPLHTALPLAADGRVRLLAIGSPARSPTAPTVPTTAEAGSPGVVVNLWYGLFGPAGLPAPIVERLNTALRGWLARPGTAEMLRAQGMTPASDTRSTALAALVAADALRWARVIEVAGITAD
ncbi:MAG: tripartite tricarboxylate transporter substrate binding protein [Acetobacteraceae bacterium]|nr:tripartite tricarboxylate transporter substrate binding protein [Acetobacteraceae bacterium]